MRLHHFSIIVCLVVTFGSGCTALNTFPKSARSGDTIALALGSPLDLTRTNTTVKFVYDSDGSEVDLTPNIRAIFKLYPDKESNVFDLSGNTNQLVMSSGHAPWVVIAAIDLPSDLNTSATQPLTGTVQFNTTAIYPGFDVHINDTPIPLEILPGVGSPADLPYQVGTLHASQGNLTRLEPDARAVFHPTFPSTLCPCPDYAAIEIKVNLPTSVGTSLTQDFIRVVDEDLTVATRSGRSFTYGLAANGEDLTVMFISPTGKLKYYESRFAVMLYPTFNFIGTPTVTSIRYFNLNGQEVTGPSADYQVALK